MIVSEVRVKNFRSVEEATLRCDPLTCLVGPNGAGKSTLLTGLDLFYATSERLTQDDFFNRNTDHPIEIAVTFRDLNEQATELFATRLDNGSLTVEKVIHWNGGRPSASYHGATLQNPEFKELRSALEQRDRGAAARAALGALKDGDRYDDLPGWSTIQGAKDALTDWEEGHPDSCERMRDDGQFFGFRQVAQGYLGAFTRFLFVPAVREASHDASEGRGSLFSELMDLAVRSVLSRRPELIELKARLQTEFAELMAPEQLPELEDLASELTLTLQRFVPSSAVVLRWLPLEDLNVPLPKATTRLMEDGFAAPVERCGHGLQRAFIFTILQHLALAKRTAETESAEAEPVGEGPEANEDFPNLVFGIEEPELYQHPNRQRHFARILFDLAQGRTPGVAERTQVLYTTHSPHFVGIDRINSVRLTRKETLDPGRPGVTRVISTTLDQVAERIWIAEGANGPRYTAETIRPRLPAIMRPWTSEGFFAKVAVLVEGDSDRAAIMGVARVLGHDLEAMGVSVIPCGGKTNIDRPFVIFQNLGIPLYVVWDGDKGDRGARPEDNHRLLRLLGRDPLDWPTDLTETFVVWEVDLETTLCSELGPERFETELDVCRERYAIPKRKHALKNSHVVGDLIQACAEQGTRAQSLEAIVSHIKLLANGRRT